MKKERYKVTGMSCSACAASVENLLKKSEGVKSASVNLTSEKVELIFDDSLTNFSVLKSKLNGIGYDILQEKNLTEEKPSFFEKSASLSAFILSITVMYAAMGNMAGFPPIPYFNESNPKSFTVFQLLLTAAVIFLGRTFFLKGFKLLFKLQPNMDSLIAIGSSAAFLFSLYESVHVFLGNTASLHHLYFESAALIISFILAGKEIEKRTKGKASEAIKKLMELSPDTVTVFESNSELEIPVSKLKKGDIVILKPGSRAAVDGHVIEGTAFFDESVVTGESMPVSKSNGSEIISGSLNLNGNIKYSAEKIGEESFINRIIKMVEDAQNKKAPIARFADVVSGWFVPVVIFISLASFIIWFAVSKDFEFSLKIAISILVIACPCALGLATPTAIMAGTGRGSELGILIRNGEVLETASKINRLFFDKTGTITKGKPELNSLIPENNFSTSELLLFAAAVEKKSEHPLGTAVINYALTNNITIPECTNFNSSAGNGVSGIVNSKYVIAGKREFLEQKGIEICSDYDIEKELQTGNSVIYIGIDNIFAGAISIGDKLRDDSAGAVEELKKMGIEPVMVTGDHKITAEAIAKKAGISLVFSQLLPADKMRIIEESNSKGYITAMVGDGINDSPALSAANVGIAIGNDTDIAKESAEIILVRENIADVVTAIKLSRKTMKNIKINLLWASIYNIIGIPIAAGVLYTFGGPLLNPIIAAAAMSFSSISVVTNAVRLRFYKDSSLYIINKQIEEENKMSEIKIDGMMCSHCTSRVKQILESIEGVRNVDVNLDKKTAYFECDDFNAVFSKAEPAITAAGYKVIK